MIQLGCLARFFNRYEDEVKFAKESNFDFMQLWYDNRGMCLHEDDKDFIDTINKHNFTTIIHAVLNINEFKEHIPKLLDILNKLNHKELIVHPICENEEINEETLDKLDKNIKYALNILTPSGITLFLENNSKLDPIFTTTDEIKEIFIQNNDLEFLLDIAHIDNMNHLQEMINVKTPKILHISDRHFDVVHEHLPLGQGDIDFQYIFSNLLPEYNGKIILEVVNKDSDILHSKDLIKSLLNTPN
ncbi:TIM barrel protein [Clostridium sp. LIBA-8841]|uniref:TIM barrel protein n=1 Tax=Clostridium sp. LIBA-8841 TaxID=2987530 RepID=UPI002AC68884|nr:TIM barrel protein [Clostridium sp. LIBA-8841]MDZ5253816.1 sugar phosphate isomerase/epimerase [Clostridium sp. LIBA-8841]